MAPMTSDRSSRCGEETLLLALLDCNIIILRFSCSQNT